MNIELNNNDIHWEILTKSGLILREGVDKKPDISDIKSFYLRQNNNCYGIYDNLLFFKNNQIYDLKISGKQKLVNIFQYKTCRHSFIYYSDEIIHNIGIETEDDSYKYKYIISISEKELTNVQLHAYKMSICNGESAYKIIPL